MPLRFLTLACLFLSALALHAEDSPSWRGPRLDGSSLETNLPVKWSAKENIAWKTDLPGVGHSSPIVSNGRVFVTACMIKDEAFEKRRMLLCLDRKDGAILWEKEVVRSPLEPKHGLNSYASATPLADGKNVWVTFARLRPKSPGEVSPKEPRGGSGNYLANAKNVLIKDFAEEMVVACYDFAGNLLWMKATGQFYSPHGFCSVPIPYKDMIIVNGDQDAEAYIVALDKKSGEERYRIPREKRIRSYCAPLIVEIAGKMQMILSGGEQAHSYDPDTGRMIWMIQGPTEQTVASPVSADGLVFLTAGFPTFHNLAIRPDGAGDVTETQILWHEKAKSKREKASYVPSPLAQGKHFYVISDVGPFHCFDSQTGVRHYEVNLGRHHSASPVIADGLIYIPDDDGITYVVKAGAKFDLLAKNELGDKCYSSPAISNGQIFLRTDHALFCIGKK